MEYPIAALEQAEQTARAPIRPPGAGPDFRDATDLPFVTIDPAGSVDLDQAMALQRHGTGYRVCYAIADVASFVPPAGPLNTETHARGVTLYSPDLRTPLHPQVLSEGAGSLLPGQDRPAVLWQIDLDADGEVVTLEVTRARIRSRAKLAYDQVQRDLDRGTPEDWLILLREIGELRLAGQAARGAVDVRVPDQGVKSADGGFRLVARTPVPIESWNAQISLLTGMCAAQTMLTGGVGILRTMPPPPEADVQAVRRTAAALGISWPSDLSYPDLVRSLDAAVPANAAFFEVATTLLRGASYTAFNGTEPKVRIHSAVAAPYAHVTAPLRRLVDRYASEVVLALHAGRNVPEWVLAALPGLPREMTLAGQRANALDRACVDYMEAILLERDVGRTYEAVVVQRRKESCIVQLADPPVRAEAVGDGLELGQRVTVRLTVADPVTRTVRFAAV